MGNKKQNIKIIVINRGRCTYYVGAKTEKHSSYGISYRTLR